jgi:hypothetical protein
MNLRPAVSTAQELLDVVDIAGHAEAILFKLLVLQVESAWHLGHESHAEASLTLCNHVAMSLSDGCERAVRVQYLIFAHFKYANELLHDEAVTAASLQRGWRVLDKCRELLHEAESTIDELKSWCSDGLQDVRIFSF